MGRGVYSGIPISLNIGLCYMITVNLTPSLWTSNMDQCFFPLTAKWKASVPPYVASVDETALRLIFLIGIDISLRALGMTFPNYTHPTISVTATVLSKLPSTPSDLKDSFSQVWSLSVAEYEVSKITVPFNVIIDLLFLLLLISFQTWVVVILSSFARIQCLISAFQNDFCSIKNFIDNTLILICIKKVFCFFSLCTRTHFWSMNIKIKRKKKTHCFPWMISGLGAGALKNKKWQN